MLKPRGKHSEIAGLLKTPDDKGYEPDVAVLHRPSLANEPRWDSSSVIEHGQSINLVVEVVSTNWRDDYLVKLADYEAFGIQEYWIVDYLGIGGRRYIGSPKQPTLTVCTLVDEEYELQQFQGNDRIVSSVFPDFPLTVAQIFSPDV